MVDALCAALADPVPAVADAAAQSLGELKEPAAGRRLLPWLGHADAFVRASIARCANCLEESAVPALAALGDPQAARCAARQVAVLRLACHQPALAELASWPAPMSTRGTPGVYRRPRPEPRGDGAAGALRGAGGRSTAGLRRGGDDPGQAGPGGGRRAAAEGPGGRLLAGPPARRAGASGACATARARRRWKIARPSHRQPAQGGRPASANWRTWPRPRPAGRRRRTAIPRCVARCASPWRNCGCRHDPAARCACAIPPGTGWLMLEWADGASAGSTMRACAPPVPVRNAGRSACADGSSRRSRACACAISARRATGVQLLSDDGHERGIYPWSYLRDEL